MPSSVTSAASIESFISAINDGIASWKKAGMILVELKRKDSEVFVKITKQFPLLKMSVLDVFYAVGLGKISPELLMLPKNVAARLLKKNPLEQSDICRNGIEVNGHKVPITQLTRKQMANLLPKNTVKKEPEHLEFIGNWVIRKTIGNNLGFERTNATGENPATLILEDGVKVVRVFRRLKTI